MNGVLAIVEKSSHRLAFYDRASAALIDTVALPRYPHELGVSADRRTAFVGHYGVRNAGEPGPGGAAIAVVDLAARRLVRLIDCTPHGRIHGVGLDGKGRLYGLSEAAGILLGFDDPANDTAPTRGVPSGGLKSHLFAVEPNGAHAYCTNLLSHTVTRIAPRDAGVAPAALVPGDRPEGLWLAPDGATLYVACRDSDTLSEVDTATMTIRRQVPTRRDPLRVYGIGDDRLLVSNCGDRTLALLDRASLAEAANLVLEGIAVAAHIAGDTAFVALTGDTCIEIDLTSLAVVRSYATGSEPDCCCLVRDFAGAA